MAATTTVGSMKKYFRRLTDPRVVGRSRHLLADIIVLAYGNGSPEVVCVVRDTGRGVGLSPQVQNRPNVLGAALPQDKITHRLPDQMRKARSRFNLPRASSLP